YHLLTTRLHEVAAGALPPAAAAVPLQAISGLRRVAVQIGRIIAIDPAAKRVTLADGTVLRADALAIALGSRPADYGIPGLTEHALTLGSLADALAVRAAVEALVARAAAGRRTRIVIGGGGVTGVQLAGELAARWRQRARRERIPAGALEIAVIEAGTRLMNGVHPALAGRAARILTSLGVGVRLRTRLSAVGPGWVSVEGSDGQRRHSCDAFVWTGGVQANPLIGRSLRTDPQGRALVDETLQAVAAPGVFVLGDNARAVRLGEARPVPPTAQAAVEQAELVAYNLAALAAGDDGRMRPYRGRQKGFVVSVGPAVAVGMLGAGAVRGSGRAWHALKRWIEHTYLRTLGIGPGWMALWEGSSFPWSDRSSA
ncbi:MAG TPA: FAD-dependent oxidoreductase, partial [Limnochordia bacterium]